MKQAAQPHHHERESGPRALARLAAVPDAWALSAGAATAIVLCYALLLLDDGWVETMVASEEGVVENVGAASLLTASILLAVAYRQTRRRAYLGLALILFLGAGEELAWGQHVLGFSAPDQVRDWNAQDETTLHNLDPVQQLRHSVGFDVVLAAASVLVTAYFVLVPALAARSEQARSAIERRMPVPSGKIGAILVLNFALFALAGALSPTDRAHAVTEVAEAGLAFTLLAYAIDTTQRHHRNRATAKPLTHPDRR